MEQGGEFSCPGATLPPVTGSKTRAALAGNTAQHGPDAPETKAARLEHQAAMLEAHVARAIAAAPELTAKQRMDIAALLLSPDQGSAA